MKDGPDICPDCKGTMLDYSMTGVERGSCHCSRPGEIKARLFPMRRVYSVIWDGTEIPVDPPTLPRAVATLRQLRDSLSKTQTLKETK